MNANMKKYLVVGLVALATVAVANRTTIGKKILGA